MPGPTHRIDRREFLKNTTYGAAAAGLAAGAASAAAPEDKKLTLTDALPARAFGKTGVKLPILGYGGAGLPKKWGNPLSTEDRVKLVRHAYDSGVRYYDTSISYTYGESQALIGKGLKGVRDNAFITTKVDFWNTSRPDGRIEKVAKGEATRQVKMNLKELQSDYIDAVLIHGTPGVEQMTVEQCLEVQAELAKARDKGLVRFVGFSAHGYFDKALALIESGKFDLCMLSYGYIPRGHNQVFSARMTALRDACIAKAHERGMGVVAMKVVGGGVLGAWSGHFVPGFDKKRIAKLPAAAIRHVLQDERIDVLTIGMRLPREINANIKTVSGAGEYTTDDRALLAEFSAKALASKAMKEMKVE